MNAFLTAIGRLFRSPANGGHSAKTKGAVAGGVIAATVALTAPFEGFFGKTYIDPVGVPTVCYGETRADLVSEGRTRTFTKAECQKMLEVRLPEYDVGLRRCLHREMPRSVHIAMLSATYNIGVAGFCKSTMARKINAGEFASACDALLAWTKGTVRGVKKDLPGLVRRREAERQVCLEDL